MSNEIAVTDAKVLANINGWGQERFLPFFQGNNFEAWKQDAALAVIENNDLRNCMATDQGKVSIVRALQRSASSGLSLNPQRGESALVAINGEVNFWPMKNGIVKKALETGALEYVEVGTVFVNDKFAIKKTAKGDDYEFEPALDNRGAVKGFFAVAVLKSGRSVIEFWTLAQAEEHKNKFGKGLKNPKSAWNTNTNAMYEKSVLKALLSGLHLPPSVARLLEMDNNAEQAEMRNVTEPPEKGVSADGLAADLAAKAEAEKGAAEAAPEAGEDGETALF
jgi:recombinational DNA repair protein RecT